MNVKAFLPIITISLFTVRAAAQTLTGDTIARTEASGIIDVYNHTIGEQSAYYNGQEYYPPAPAVKGSPFFQGKMSMQPSQIRYNGFWYSGVPVFYDMLNDVMVSAASNVLYTIRNSKLTDVLLGGHHFVYLDEKHSANLGAGYYDRLYGGKSEVLVKRSSGVVNRAGDRAVEVFYQDNDIIYIRKNDRYVQVSSRGSVLSVLNDRSKQLKQYLSANKMDYGNDKEASIVKLVTYYDQVSN